jgi:hypothetical protein
MYPQIYLFKARNKTLLQAWISKFQEIKREKSSKEEFFD